MKIKLLLTAILVLGCKFTFGQTLTPQVLSTSGNNSLNLSWTIGQVADASIKSNNVILTQGFHQPTYSIVTSSDLDIAKLDVSFYPNPSTGLINIIYNSPKKNRIELLDLKGRVLFSSYIKGNMQIDLSKYSSNLYIIRIGTETFKVVKQ